MSSLVGTVRNVARTNQEKIAFLDSIILTIQNDRDISRIADQTWRAKALHDLHKFRQDRSDVETGKQVLYSLGDLLQFLKSGGESSCMVLNIMAEFSRKFPSRGNKPSYF